MKGAGILDFNIDTNFTRDGYLSSVGDTFTELVNLIVFEYFREHYKQSHPEDRSRFDFSNHNFQRTEERRFGTYSHRLGGADSIDIDVSCDLANEPSDYQVSVSLKLLKKLRPSLTHLAKNVAGDLKYRLEGLANYVLGNQVKSGMLSTLRES